MLKFLAEAVEVLDNIPIQMEDFGDLEGSASKVFAAFFSTCIVAFIGHRTKVEIAKIQQSESNNKKRQQSYNIQREEIRKITLEKEALNKKISFLQGRLTRIQFRCEAALQATLINYIPPDSRDRIIEELERMENYNIDRLIDSTQEQERIIRLMRENFKSIQEDSSDGANH